MTINDYTEQDFRTDISNTTPSQAGYEAMVRLGENNGWLSDDIRNIIDKVWEGHSWVTEDETETLRLNRERILAQHMRKVGSCTYYVHPG